MKDKFFNSKTKIFLFVLILVSATWFAVSHLFLFDIVNDLPEKDENFPVIRYEMSATELETKDWIYMPNTYDAVKKCLGENTGMIIFDAVKESIIKCPEVLSISVAPGVNAVIKNTPSYSTDYFLLEFQFEGDVIEEIPLYKLTQNSLAEGSIGVSYFDQETIAIRQQCSSFELCYDFLSFGTWLKPEEVVTDWIGDGNRFEEFYSSYPIGIQNSNVVFTVRGITKDGKYVFTEKEGACDECLGSLSFVDQNDENRFKEKGALNFVFTNDLDFVGFGYLKE